MKDRSDLDPKKSFIKILNKNNFLREEKPRNLKKNKKTHICISRVSKENTLTLNIVFLINQIIYHNSFKHFVISAILFNFFIRCS